MRIGTLGEDRVNLDIFSISTSDYYVDRDKIEVKNTYTNNVDLYEGATVSVVTTLYQEDGYENRKPVSFVDNMIVMTCNNVDKTFSFLADKYVDLFLNAVSIEVENGVLYLCFNFDSWHYFNKLDDYGIDFYVIFSTSERSNKRIVFTGCQYVTNDELKWRYNAETENIDEFMCSIFRNDNYEFIGYGEYNEEVDEKFVLAEEIPDKACFNDELYLKKKITYSESPECWRYELYEKSCNEGTLFGVSAKRDNFRFKKISQTEEYFLTPLVSVPVPISLKSGNNTYQEQNINDNFVKSSVEKAKNKTVEMEKFVYHPVFKVGGEYKPIHKIKFNLHFREREEDGWIVKPEGYWNGMDALNGVHGNTGVDNNLQFFSYSNIDTDDPQGRQSDLLCYLGFNNSDVKYQKSKLKKSFLRLSFYDSKNRANQNLLCYATLFMDSGKLFARMMKGANQKRKYVISDQDNSLRYDDLKVDREPCYDRNVFNEEVEEYRLSSQIVVSDRFSSTNSEGFYLYLWADNDKGKLPTDIYMRVEFNHAGYGRVIPFTMPYFKEGNTSKIYTFSQIYTAWVPSDPTQRVGWGVTKNEEFSYIHFKYVYDEDSKQHVYYLDGDTYGMGSFVDETPDELELNLYESKINFE